MAKNELKTQKTEASVEGFLNSIADEQKRADSFVVADMMSQLTGAPPKMWGPAIVGFGSRVLKYDSGRELDWMQIGFSPRKANLTFYIGIGEATGIEDLLGKLGKHTTGKGCLYVKRLSDVDPGVLKKLIATTLKQIKAKSK
jgi:hypothetical protein